MAKKYYLDGKVFRPRNGVRVTTFVGQEDPVSLNEIIEEVVGISLPVVPATTTVQGIVELATNAEAIAKASTTVVLTPSNLAALGASTTFAGLTEFSTDAEALAKVSTTTALTPSNLAALGATETFAGLVELATDAEAIAGVSTTVAITPANLTAALSTAGDLESVLTNGNNTGANDIELADNQFIIAENGGGRLDLRYGGTNNNIALTTDGGNFLEGWFYADPTFAQMGYTVQDYVNASTNSVFMQSAATASFIAASRMGMYDTAGLFPNCNINLVTVGGAPVTSYSQADVATFINTGTLADPSTYNNAVQRSVILGGYDIIAKTSNTAYCNQLGINFNSAFETIISNNTLTGNRTASFPDASGKVAVVRVVATAVNHNAQDGEIILGTVGAGGITVTLPSAATASDMQITVKQVDNGGGNLGIVSAGGTIDGSALPYAVPAQYNGYQFTSDGANWWVTGIF